MRCPARAPKPPIIALLPAIVLLSACSAGSAPAPLANVAAPTVAPAATTAPAATPAPSPTFAPAPAPVSLPWWQNETFYEIFVRSFQDSDGDGNGDLKGLISKLDYLNDGDPNTATDLGITGICLMPIMPSPSYHGHDVTKYEDINPQYDLMADFKQFLAEAHGFDGYKPVATLPSYSTFVIRYSR